MTDARFEDGADRPLHLAAQEAGDLPVISALVQDAVFPVSELRWARRRRRLMILLNRFRWEDRAAAEARGRPYERVRSMLVVGDVTRVAVQGVDPADHDVVLSLLSLTWEEGADGAGRLLLTKPDEDASNTAHGHPPGIPHRRAARRRRGRRHLARQPG
jgi:hypothetical protein